mgnify:CR=1 FL=1
MTSKPSLPRGTRDFGPETMAKRNYIFQHIRTVFQKFGFSPIETPTMENLSVLMGKYGEEGDQLLFKILNSGNFLSSVDPLDYAGGAKKILPKIAEKGLRYDLTVPFARFVAMHRNEIAMPFKRYQIQPVWRADRPQKGRYREFYQCDADVVGTNSLLCEAEIVCMLHEIFEKLALPDFVIKINNRKILSGIAEVIGKPGKEAQLCVAIDKLDKIGQEKVEEELQELQVEVDAASDKIEEEFGDVLFSMINYARFLNVNPENALEKTNKKFIARFQKMEEMAARNKEAISDLSFEALDNYWNQAKLELRDK